VVALDAGSGCVRWSYPTGSRIVRAVTVAPLNNSNVVASQGHRSLALFGDDSGTLFALNAATGKEVWRQKVYDHVLARITAAPTVFAGIAYVPISSMEDPLTHDQKHFCCSARGGIAAVDIATGNIVWQKQHFDEPLRHIETQQITGERIFQQGPAGASTYTPLSIDAKRKLVYATTAEEYGFTNAPGPYSVVAYSLNDGELVWQRQLLPAEKDRKRICAERETDCRNFFSAGTSVLLFPASAEKDIAVVGMKSGWVHGLDPSDNGRVIWSTRVAQGGDLGGVMYGLAADSQHVYVPVSDVDSPDGRYTGTLVALDPKTGNIKWRTDPPQAACSWGMEHCVAGQVAAVTVVSDMVFANFWDGLVRIYNAKNGELIRSLDTAVNYKAVNGTAVGGQVSGYPVSVGSRAIYITSGASSVMKSGNALLKLTFDQSTDGQ
jgi:polyvinyl alcohol dehydrogenase (cytochrome)